MLYKVEMDKRARLEERERGTEVMAKKEQRIEQKKWKNNRYFFSFDSVI